MANYERFLADAPLMGPNSLLLLDELYEKAPLENEGAGPILDLGCGTGLTSAALAEKTGANVLAADLWVDPKENEERFAKWGVSRLVHAARVDAANGLPLGEKTFAALVSVDAYHYFGAKPGFFAQRILPVLRDGAAVRIAVPGVQDAYAGRAVELLSDWVHEDAGLFRSPQEWKALLGEDERIEQVRTWEMQSFDAAWKDWLETDNSYAKADREHFETLIRPFTCFVGINVTLRK